MTLRHIICAVRGGSPSEYAVTRAIDLTLENGGRLTFSTSLPPILLSTPRLAHCVSSTTNYTV